MIGGDNTTVEVFGVACELYPLKNTYWDFLMLNS